MSLNARKKRRDIIKVDYQNSFHNYWHVKAGNNVHNLHIEYITPYPHHRLQH